MKDVVIVVRQRMADVFSKPVTCFVDDDRLRDCV